MRSLLRQLQTFRSLETSSFSWWVVWIFYLSISQLVLWLVKLVAAALWPHSSAFLFICSELQQQLSYFTTISQAARIFFSDSMCGRYQVPYLTDESFKKQCSYRKSSYLSSCWTVSSRWTWNDYLSQAQSIAWNLVESKPQMPASSPPPCLAK